MKRKLNKWLSGVLAACVLFTTVPVYAINNVSGTETSTEVVETSEETQSSEIETSSAEETVQALLKDLHYLKFLLEHI